MTPDPEHTDDQIREHARKEVILEALELAHAFEMIRPYGFSLHTCDMGYRCCIYMVPEAGERMLGDAVADTIIDAIHEARKQAQNQPSRDGFLSESELRKVEAHVKRSHGLKVEPEGAD